MSEEKVVILEEEKQRRDVEAFWEQARNFKGFDIDLDIARKNVRFDGACFGWEDPTKHAVSVCITDLSVEPHRVFASIYMNLEQWEAMKKLVDGLFTASSECMAQIASKKK